MGRKWEIDVVCEFVCEPDVIQVIFEDVEGRVGDNSRREFVPDIRSLCN